MKRWDSGLKAEVERPDIDDFLEEVIDVCRKYGMWLSHEDGHGSFMVDFDDETSDWLMNASIEAKK